MFDFRVLIQSVPGFVVGFLKHDRSKSARSPEIVKLRLGQDPTLTCLVFCFFGKSCVKPLRVSSLIAT